MCQPNVLRLDAIDCSSPMSAKTERNTGTDDPGSAGMCSPACAISGSRPAVFSATVLPPVLGPVTSSAVAGGTSLMSTGVGVSGSPDTSSAYRDTTPRISSG